MNNCNYQNQYSMWGGSSQAELAKLQADALGSIGGIGSFLGNALHGDYYNSVMFADATPSRPNLTGPMSDEVLSSLRKRNEARLRDAIKALGSRWVGIPMNKFQDEAPAWLRK